MHRNLLKGTRCYLVGHMQYAEGQSWRDWIQPKLESMGVTVFNPYQNNYVEKIDEGNHSREQMLKDIKEHKYDLVTSKMKTIRAYDLALVDKSDFIISYIIPEVASWGSQEEITLSIRQKKPLFLAVEGGKQKTSLWHFAQVPHEYIFDSVEEILNELEEIDKGEKYPDSSRWRLLLKDKR